MVRRGGAAALGVLVLSFLGLEVGARVMDGVPLTRFDNFIAVDLARAVHHRSNRHDETLGWTLAENLKAGSADYSFTTGPLGLRMPGPEFREPETRAVVAVGDSFTAGSEVSDEYAWPAQLEQMLGRPVHNGAAGGYGVDQIVLRAESLLDALDPEVLILSLLADDSLRNSYRVYGAPKPYFDIVDGSLALRGVPVPMTTSRSGDIGLLRSVLGHSYLLHKAATQFGFYDRWVDNALRFVRAHDNEAGTRISCLLMDRLAHLRDERGVRLLVMIQYAGPAAIDDEPPWYGKQVVECARKAGLETIDTYPPLHAVARSGIENIQKLYVMHDDNRVYGHMSPAGNRFIAELVKKALESPTYSGEAANR